MVFQTGLGSSTELSPFMQKNFIELEVASVYVRPTPAR